MLCRADAGFMDSIVMTWIIEDHSEDVVQCIHQRDLFAAALSEDIKRASWLGHEAQVRCDVRERDEV